MILAKPAVEPAKQNVKLAFLHKIEPLMVQITSVNVINIMSTIPHSHLLFVKVNPIFYEIIIILINFYII